MRILHSPLEGATMTEVINGAVYQRTEGDVYVAITGIFRCHKRRTRFRYSDRSTMHITPELPK